MLEGLERAIKDFRSDASSMGITREVMSPSEANKLLAQTTDLALSKILLDLGTWLFSV